MLSEGKRPSGCARAWVEIDLSALANNVADLRAQLPAGCELMAVVKADAYGHGADRVAARLRDEGVDSFNVATVDEGVRLRESGLAGEILVLGYTHPDCAEFLSTYRLAQLVVDGEYAKSLDAAGFKIDVHIAVDTGMHRLGIEPSHFNEIEEIFSSKNLKVEGVATHLASSDSLTEDDLIFTSKQMEEFKAVVDALKSRGHDVGKLHAQASYGIYNHPEISCDYARAGIALYGVMSYDGETKIKPALRPVLSLKALVAQVREIGAGEGVSYNRTFTADKPMKLATVSVGYADGVPRQMSGKGAACLINGRKVPVIGLICMDMLIIDVTEAGCVSAGDIVTLIGRDGDEEIRCEEVAAASGTITNDILCRLGSRLPRVYLD